ncbi:GerMN domain-containing protein [Rubripirellula amarantea]|nr:GerMN domain-containing protein [Rubripirellula amarantea]
MNHVSQASSEPSTHEVCFGLRIESHAIQLAIATPMDNGRYRLTFDQVDHDGEVGWLTNEGASAFEAALEMLADRHQMRRHAVSVSLDGDFCVTRVTIGSPEEVDHDLETLATRIPRYLQLGPGEKVTGSARIRIEPSTDYAVTGVVNRSLIQIIYDAFRNIDMDVKWVEPSLVSVARLVGRDKRIGDTPILVADGMGKQWDVGIACAGMLLLDYRPAAAHHNAGFCEALVGHFSRLKRFCHRHRRVATGELEELLICGPHEKTNDVIALLKDSDVVRPAVLQIPDLPELYEINSESNETNHVPSVATVFPLLIRLADDGVPDLLDHVRRAPDLSWGQRLVYQCWPIAVACLTLMIAYAMVATERNRHAGKGMGRAELQAQITATQTKFAAVSKRRELLTHLNRISAITTEPNWHKTFKLITQSLPETVRLEEFRIESSNTIQLNGMTVEESVIYDLVNSLRHLPGVTQVALKGTSPEPDTQSTRFIVRLTIRSASSGLDNQTGAPGHRMAQRTPLPSPKQRGQQ